ncbi:30S ribosomal protein S8 [Candidatus Pacearchaeota archaeon]|nr:30S ribosomal protein S8 [Candidatus Pacearchaeota archaeon]
MSQDIVSDGLNRIMNAKLANQDSITLRYHSKFLQNILAIGKLKGYISEYSVTPKGLFVQFGKLNKCKAVKPRYIVKVKDIDKYIRRYLPARGMGTLIISTSKGLVTHQTAIDKNIGGSVVAYFY